MLLEKEMVTHSSVLTWRIPGTGKPSGLPSMGSHRVGHDWSDAAAAAAAGLSLISYNFLTFWLCLLLSLTSRFITLAPSLISTLKFLTLLSLFCIFLIKLWNWLSIQAPEQQWRKWQNNDNFCLMKLCHAETLFCVPISLPITIMCEKHYWCLAKNLNLGPFPQP